MYALIHPWVIHRHSKYTSSHTIINTMNHKLVYFQHVSYLYKAICFILYMHECSCYTGKFLQLHFLKNWLKSCVLRLCRITTDLQHFLQAKMSNRRQRYEKVMSKNAFPPPSLFTYTITIVDQTYWIILCSLGIPGLGIPTAETGLPLL